jgi:hypothetical protein
MEVKMKKSIFFFVCLVFFFSEYLLAQDVDSLKKEIYSKLTNPHCNMPLTECECPVAKEIKGYIDALLETGVAKEEIYYKVARRFSLKAIADTQIKDTIEKRLVKDAGDKRPQIILEPNSFHFGKVSKKQGKVAKIFKVYNKGNAELIITNIRVSCVCITASLKVGENKSPYFGVEGAKSGWQEKINPQESGGLEVVFDLTDPAMVAGEQTRSIFIASNDPLYPETSIRVEVEVIE